MLFAYEAKNRSGKTVSGVLDAANAREASYALYRKKLDLVRLTPQRDRRVPARDVLLTTRVLVNGLAARLPLPKALETAREELPRRHAMRGVLDTILASVRSGSSFSEALDRHPAVFPDVYRSLVQAGEKSGRLAQTLDQALLIFSKGYALRRKVLSALAYPGFVLAFGIAVLVFFMTGIIPRFQQSYRELGQSLPAFTATIMAVSGAVGNNLHWIASGLAAVLTAWWLYRRTAGGRIRTDSWMLRAPFYGSMIRKTASARFARTVGVLLTGGRTVPDALRLARGLLPNACYHDAIDRGVKSLEEGQGFAMALRETGFFPPALVQMAAMGEETGKLAELLVSLADFYEKELDLSVETITGLLTPVLIVILGVIVGVMAFGLFLPIIEIGTVIK